MSDEADFNGGSADITWSDVDTSTWQHIVLYHDPSMGRMRRLLVRLHLARRPQAKILAVGATEDHSSELSWATAKTTRLTLSTQPLPQSSAEAETLDTPPEQT